MCYRQCTVQIQVIKTPSVCYGRGDTTSPQLYVAKRLTFDKKLNTAYNVGQVLNKETIILPGVIDFIEPKRANGK